jgi:proteasome accessory factor B
VLESARAIRRSPENNAYVKTLEALMRAWVSGRTVRMWYQTPGKGDATERLFDIYFVEPLEYVFSCYAIGFDHSHGEVRSFKIKRIRRLDITEQKYRIPAKFDIFKRWADSWSMLMAADTPPILVRLAFSKNIAFMIKEAVWHKSQEIEDTEDGGCLMKVTVNDLSEIKLWVRTWGAEVEVLEPESLRRQVALDSMNVFSLYKDAVTVAEQRGPLA